MGGSMLRLIRQHLLKQRGHWKPVFAVLGSFSYFTLKGQQMQTDTTRFFKIKAQTFPVLAFYHPENKLKMELDQKNNIKHVNINVIHVCVCLQCLL